MILVFRLNLPHDLYTFFDMFRFDSDLSAAKDESSSEVQAKEKLAREKEQLQNDISELKEKVKVHVNVYKAPPVVIVNVSCTLLYVGVGGNISWPHRGTLLIVKMLLNQDVVYSLSYMKK